MYSRPLRRAPLRLLRPAAAAAVQRSEVRSRPLRSRAVKYTVCCCLPKSVAAAEQWSWPAAARWLKVETRSQSVVAVVRQLWVVAESPVEQCSSWSALAAVEPPSRAVAVRSVAATPFVAAWAAAATSSEPVASWAVAAAAAGKTRSGSVAGSCHSRPGGIAVAAAACRKSCYSPFDTDSGSAAYTAVDAFAAAASAAARRNPLRSGYTAAAAAAGKVIDFVDTCFDLQLSEKDEASFRGLQKIESRVKSDFKLSPFRRRRRRKCRVEEEKRRR